MKKTYTLFLFFMALWFSAQQSANRFFYELSFKPKQDSLKRDKVITTLDIATDKSIYQDYTMAAQDSIMKSVIEEMQQKQMFKDITKIIRFPKFSYKIYKKYPEMTITYVDRISMNLFGYEDNASFEWKILPEKQKIGEYDAQKATTTFGGREWTAWFSSDIPFSDGPYKFYGLPGLIVKIEDSDKDYSWVLSGNKTVKDWKELSYAEEINAKMGMMSNDIKTTTKEKFEKSYSVFKQDPMRDVRTRIPENMMSITMPGSDTTIGQMIKQQEKILKDFMGANDNPIERKTVAPKTKK